MCIGSRTYIVLGFTHFFKTTESLSFEQVLTSSQWINVVLTTKMFSEETLKFSIYFYQSLIKILDAFTAISFNVI